MKIAIAIAIILLAVNKVFFISFIGKLAHNHLQKCLFNATKTFFRNFHSLSSGIFEIFDLQKIDYWKKVKKIAIAFLRSRSSRDLSTKWRSLMPWYWCGLRLSLPGMRRFWILSKLWRLYKYPPERWKSAANLGVFLDLCSKNLAMSLLELVSLGLFSEIIRG